ncbi:MAG: F0F1 ATP synthase subunit delta [Actinobacteria bacterium]|nr:F0F1 ATP synthase subunit delta [Actinomycetota bacterium]
MRVHFGGSSRQSLVAMRSALDNAVKGVSADVASSLSTELFFATDVLAGNISLRRALTDPSRDTDAKVNLVNEIFGKVLGAPSLGLLKTLASLRWSSSGDLVPIVEQLAIEAEASSANIANYLDILEEELFQVSQTISGSFDLRKALTTKGADVAKSSLVTNLLRKANASTSTLVVQLVTHLRGRSIEGAFADYLYALAARRDRVIAHVRVANEMSPTQKERLVRALTANVGQPVRVNIEIDPTVIGGVSVKFADELVDGTISRRLAGAGRALAGQKN